MKTWNVNGCELHLDLTDADTVERYESAFDQLSEEAAQIPEDARASVRIRAYCAMYRRLYDRIFGEGTSEQIFREIPDNTTAYDGVYASFLEFAAAQTTEIAKAKAERAEHLRRFLPNRAQHRAGK